VGFLASSSSKFFLFSSRLGGSSHCAIPCVSDQFPLFLNCPRSSLSFLPPDLAEIGAFLPFPLPTPHPFFSAPARGNSSSLRSSAGFFFSSREPAEMSRILRNTLPFFWGSPPFAKGDVFSPSMDFELVLRLTVLCFKKM